MRALVWLGLMGSLISIMSVLSAYHIVFDLLAHFRIQYIVLISLVLCLSMACKRVKSTLVLIACLAFHIAVVAASFSQPTFEADLQGPQLRVMSSNLLYGNADSASHLDFIKTVSPDVIVFQEYTYDWQAALTPALEDYAYRIEDPTIHAFGSALFSKYPITDMSTPYLVDARQRSVDGTIEIGGATLRIYNTHPPPPMSTKMYEHRNTHLQRLADTVESYAKPLVIMGDLNISPWSNHFKTFLKNGNLYDGRAGQGVLPTWPAYMLPVQIPIDHILFNDEVRVLSMHTSSGLSSDHKAVWADIQIAK